MAAEFPDGPCGHDICRNLGMAYGDGTEIGALPTDGYEARFNAVYNVVVEKIRVHLMAGAETVEVWRCSACKQTWCIPCGRLEEDE